MANPDVPGYRIERLLGRGGFASVYLASDATGSPVALKVLHEHTAEQEDLRRFDRERRSLAALSGHPHIVDILDFGSTTDGMPYLALEYVAGGSIGDQLAQSGAIHWADATRIGVQICDALSAAHRAGVLHRDIKPANVLDDGNVAKLGDFGIARLVGQSQLTAAQSFIGTIAYTPPEVLHNRGFDGRGDIYQLGITLYEMLLGRAPFKSGASDNKAMVIRRILEHPAPPLAQFDIPEPLSDLLDEVLAKDPADRPQTAEAFGRMLNDVEVRLGRPWTKPLTVASLTPTAPGITAPEGPATTYESLGDATVAEQPVDGATRVTTTAAPTPERPAAMAPTANVVVEQASGPPPRRRWPLLALLTVIVAVAAGGATYLALAADGDGSTDPTDAPGDGTPVVTVPDDVELEFQPTMTRVVDNAFLAPDEQRGIIFDVVANSFGLTAVGATGSGDSAPEQISTVWTMKENGDWDFQSGFASADDVAADGQRLWGIGVLDGKQFLAVGEDGSNGVAWIGDAVRRMRPIEDPTFSDAPSRLFGAIGDAGVEEFLVVGQRTVDGTKRPGLWRVTDDEEGGWEQPVWSPIDVFADSEGSLVDVAIAGETAVAVGHLGLDADPTGVVIIRRNDAWQNLIAPVPGLSFTAVDIFGDRIVVVGNRNPITAPEPIAIVADIDGVGLQYDLPLAEGRSGKVNDVVETAAGVFAVGLAGEREGTDVFGSGETDGALWELIANDAGDGELWTTRESDQLDADGFQEFWSVVEFDGRVFAAGTADGNQSGTTVAAVWTVSARQQSGEISDDVEEALADAAPEEPAEPAEDGNVDLGTAAEGCAAQAELDAAEQLGVGEVELTPVLIDATEGFAVWICSDAEGRLWYHGAQREGDLSITRPAIEEGEGYLALGENGTAYRIADGRLTVRNPNGSLVLDEALLG